MAKIGELRNRTWGRDRGEKEEGTRLTWAFRVNETERINAAKFKFEQISLRVIYHETLFTLPRYIKKIIILRVYIISSLYIYINESIINLEK